MRFVLTIELGNDAMQTPEDVAHALGAVAIKLQHGTLSGNVRDWNGQTVGTFAFESPTTAEQR